METILYLIIFSYCLRFCNPQDVHLQTIQKTMEMSLMTNRRFFKMLKMTLLMIQRLFKSVLIKINAPDAGTKQLYHHWRLGPFERFDIDKKIY